MENGDTNLLRSYTYDSYGKVTKITEYPGYAEGSTANAIEKSYTYDSHDRILSMVYKKGGETLESYSYQYDKNSNITEAALVNGTAEKEADRVNETRSYTYDPLGQLVQTEITDHTRNDQVKTISYTYDPAGNRTGKNENGESASTISYTYNGLDQLVAENGMDAGNTQVSKSYGYDANGNQTSETDSSTGTTVTNSYNAANQLVTSMMSQNGTAVLTQRNTYNGSGQRIRKTETTVQDGDGAAAQEGTESPAQNGTESTVSTGYHYQEGTVSYTTDSDGNKRTQYLMGASGNAIGLEQSVTLPGEGEDAADAESKLYYLFDKDIQGSTTSLLNSEGEGTVSYEYTDFGETTILESGGNQAENEIFYTGGIYDESTGLYYLNARYYYPDLGVFLTEDSYRGETGSVDTWNLYACCNGNPVNCVDPSGHATVALASAGYHAVSTVTVSSMAFTFGGAAFVIVAVYGTVKIGGKVYRKVKAKKKAKPKR